jgi:hypothetical protein
LKLAITVNATVIYMIWMWPKLPNSLSSALLLPHISPSANMTWKHSLGSAVIKWPHLFLGSYACRVSIKRSACFCWRWPQHLTLFFPQSPLKLYWSKTKCKSVIIKIDKKLQCIHKNKSSRHDFLRTLLNLCSWKRGSKWQTFISRMRD